MLVLHMFAVPIQSQPAVVHRANPCSYVSAATPPMLIVHGDEDKLVPHHQSRLLAAALEAAGSRNLRLHIVRGGGHGEGFDSDPDLLALVQKFLHAHLKQASSPRM